MKTGTTTLFLAGLLTAGAVPVLGQSQWSQFRGPGGSGIAPDGKELPIEFGPEKNLLWSCDVPPGHSSPCIFDDRIFVTGATDRDLQTICVDRRTGAVLWERRAFTDTFERRHRINSSATPTAAADGERVYVYFGSSGLACFDFEGNEKWMRRMRIPENMYGVATSPIVADGKLVFLSDNASGASLETIDGETGQTLWKKDRPGFGAGWSSPMHWKNQGVDELVIYGTGWITAYALEDGQERWSVPGMTNEPCITPVSGEGVIFLTSYNMRDNPEVIGLPSYGELLDDYDQDEDGELTFAEIRANESILSRSDADGEGNHPLPGFFRFLDTDQSGKLTMKEWEGMYAFLDQFEFTNALIAIRPGSGESETEILWQYPRGVPECPSPLYYDGRVTMVKNGGLATCVDAKTGELLFQGRLESGGPYYSSPVAGDGKIFSASARGVVTVFRAGDTLEVLANNDLGDRIMATPALVDGTVYVRTENKLFAFGLKP
jgi:outer membrane protein assembly factor BamB